MVQKSRFMLAFTHTSLSIKATNLKRENNWILLLVFQEIKNILTRFRRTLDSKFLLERDETNWAAQLICAVLWNWAETNCDIPMQLICRKTNRIQNLLHTTYCVIQTQTVLLLRCEFHLFIQVFLNTIFMWYKHVYQIV